jgi:hypothetical protein
LEAEGDAQPNCEQYVFQGFSPALDQCVPDYSLDWGERGGWEKWGYAITTRGCVNRCGYCAVPRLENVSGGGIEIVPNWKEQIVPSRSCVLLDNNITASLGSHLEDVVKAFGKTKALWDNGIDCKHVDHAIAALLGKVNWAKRGLRIAFDRIKEDGVFQFAVRLLIEHGVNPWQIMAYLLYNYEDTPQEAEYRLLECARFGIQPYPLRFIPLNQESRKIIFVGRHWTKNLGMAFQHYGIMGKFRGQNKLTTFGEFVQKPDVRARFDLSEADLDAYGKEPWSVLAATPAIVPQPARVDVATPVLIGVSAPLAVSPALETFAAPSTIKTSAPNTPPALPAPASAPLANPVITPALPLTSHPRIKESSLETKPALANQPQSASKEPEQQICLSSQTYPPPFDHDQRQQLTDAWGEETIAAAERFLTDVNSADGVCWSLIIHADELRRQFPRKARHGHAGWIKFCEDVLGKSRKTVGAYLACAAYCDDHVPNWQSLAQDGQLPPYYLVARLSRCPKGPARDGLHSRLFAGEYEPDTFDWECAALVVKDDGATADRPECGEAAVNILIESYPELEAELNKAARTNPGVSFAELNSIAQEKVRGKQDDLLKNAGKSKPASRIPQKDEDYHQAAAEVDPIITHDDRTVCAEFNENTLLLKFPWTPTGMGHVANALHDLPVETGGNAFRFMSNGGLVIKILNEEKAL